MYNYLAADALVFIAEQENALLNRMKKYFAENMKLIVMGFISISGDYRAYHAYSKMLNDLRRA